MAISNSVQVSIDIASSAVSAPGFGIPLILPLTVPAGFTERTRTYTSAADMLDDGFLVTDQAYLEALTITSQRPRPQRFKVGRRATAVAQSRVLTLPADPTDSVAYPIVINGVTINTATLDGTSTTAELQAALVTAINASSQAGLVTAANSGADVIVTSDQAGIPFTVALGTQPAAPIVLGAAVANVGIPEDLAAIEDYDADWYGLIITQRDDNSIRVAAQQIEAMRRVFFAQSSDTAMITAAYNPADTTLNIAAELKGLGYLRTSVWFNADDESLAGGIGGQMLARVPGSATTMYKAVAGVTPRQYTATERSNLESHNANGYTTDGGRNYTFRGTMAEGEWFDIMHGIDKLTSRIETLVFGAFLKEAKIPYTQKGLEQIAGLIGVALRESTTEGVIAESRTLENGDVESPAWSITVPKIQDIPSATRETREVTSSYPITFEATLAGAIHLVTITGTVSF